MLRRDGLAAANPFGIKQRSGAQACHFNRLPVDAGFIKNL
jgi:hypothetical protein